MSLVKMLAEGADMSQFALASGPSLSVQEAKSYTLESGAFKIARECLHEMHEIFEVAVIATEEAELSAYMESGKAEIMESATYLPVYEAAEESTFQQVIAWIKKQLARIGAFLENCAAKVNVTVDAFGKYVKTHEKALKEAKPVTVKGVTNWNTKEIARVTGVLNGIAGVVTNYKEEIMTISQIMGIEDSSERGRAIEDFNASIDAHVEEALKKFSEGGSVKLSMADIESAEELTKKFTNKFKSNNTKSAVEVSYKVIESHLTDVSKTAKDIMTTKKAFNKAYDENLKQLNWLYKKLNNEKNAGYAQLISKYTSGLTKIQKVANMYATVGFNSVIGSANEYRRLGNILISGKVPEEGN